MANRLADSTSPYLLAHAANPVDWWEWEEAAFEEAWRRNLPVLLSVGYAACHWCHVMAQDSFEDEATAAYLNEHFVSIKIDREERPDVDAVYMNATQAITGHGGWPMTCVLDHDRVPFFAGTCRPRAPCPPARWGAMRWPGRSAPWRASPTRPTPASAAPRSSRPRWRWSSCCATTLAPATRCRSRCSTRPVWPWPAAGGFASALDADTEGVEGKFYAWTPAQLREALGDEDGAWAAEVFTVTEAGTYDPPALEPGDQPS